MTGNRYEQWLRWLLVLSGLCMLLAVVPMVMPYSWIAWTHEKLDLGTFPAAPVAEYLARVTSALYAAFGALMLLVARDVRKYAAVITYLAVAMPAISIGIAPFIRMPFSWVASDVISASAFGVATLILQGMVRKNPPPAAGQ